MFLLKNKESGMTNKVILSICIPTFNRAGLLDKTLNAICQQINNRDGVEIIVSDNSSTDDTKDVVGKFQNSNLPIKYYCNEKNLGLDLNTLKCVQYANGEYCWLCSDDDIPLNGSLDRILSVIDQYSPTFVYLNYAGFLENEPYEVVLKRERDKKDKVYYDPEKMIRELFLNHFSAAVVRRDLLLRYSYILGECEKENFVRGYFVNINHYVILTNPGPYVFIGNVSLSVRKPISLTGNFYNPLTTLIDISKHYQILRQKGLIGSNTENYVLNSYLRGFYKLVLPMKCFRHPLYTKEIENMIYSYCRKYKDFWLYLYSFLVLPYWFLFIPYVFARCTKSILRKIFVFSPFK